MQNLNYLNVGETHSVYSTPVEGLFSLIRQIR